jgi:hypothetical protein
MGCIMRELVGKPVERGQLLLLMFADVCQRLNNCCASFSDAINSLLICPPDLENAAAYCKLILLYSAVEPEHPGPCRGCAVP